MPDNTFRLFPDDKEASPGDALIQFLIEEQQKGNKRAKSIGKFLSQQMGKVFPGFDRALGDITSGAEERKQQLNAIFGLGIGESNISPGEAALGFGVGSITKVVGSGARSGKQRLIPSRDQKPSGQIRGEELFEIGDTKLILETVQKSKRTSQDLGQIPGVVKGQKPPSELLEAQAIKVQTAKRIEANIKTEINKIQKDLDKQLLKRVDPNDPSPRRLIVTKNKGIKKVTAVFNERTENFGVEFRSTLKKTENPEFVLEETPKGLFLAVDFNSVLIKPQLQGIFRRNFNNRFVRDEIEPDALPGVKQRLETGVSEGAKLPDNFSVFKVDSFDNALQLINKMLDRAKQIKSE